jgi:hypothetical protein
MLAHAEETGTDAVVGPNVRTSLVFGRPTLVAEIATKTGPSATLARPE